jgi:hypothetical protein
MPKTRWKAKPAGCEEEPAECICNKQKKEALLQAGRSITFMI